MSISFYSIGPVTCDELFQNACYRVHGTEHFYTVLPFFIPIFAIGLIVFLKSVNLLQRPQRKTLSIIYTVTAIIISVIVLYGGQPFLVEINGLNPEYVSGEPITFEIQTIGFGNVCSVPHVQVIRTDRPWPQDGSNIIWSNNYETGCIGNPHYRFFNHVWTVNEISDSGSLFVNETGVFELHASHGNKQTDKQFVIHELKD